MYQQRVKLNQISIVALGLASFLIIIALMKNIYFLILIVHYCITVSLICDGLLSMLTFNKQGGMRLLLLGALLFTMTTYLLFLYFKSD